MRSKAIIVLCCLALSCASVKTVTNKAASKGTTLVIATAIAGAIGFALGGPPLAVVTTGVASGMTVLILEDEPVNINVEDGGAVALGGKQDANQLRDMIAKARAAGAAEAAREKDSWWSDVVRRLKRYAILSGIGLFVWLRRGWLWKAIRGSSEFTRLGSLLHAFWASEKTRVKAMKAKV